MASDRSVNYGRLLAAMMRQKQRRGCDELDLDALANDTSIWTKKGASVQTVSLKKLKKVLMHLRSRHLHSALTVRADAAWLHPSVRFETTPPPKRPRPR